MSTFASELRFAVRALLQQGAFTAAATLTLAVGIALCTTVMVAVNAYLLTGLPYLASERLYWIRYVAPGQEQLRNLETLDWRSLDDVVEHPIAWDLDMFYLLGGEYAESAPGAWVTPGFIQGFGIQPAIGRGFEPGAFAPGAPNVALISHVLWTNRFAADPHIVGRTFTAYVSDRPHEAETFTIVGVLPERFWHINPYTEVIVPLRAPTYPYMARLRAGVTPAAAAARIGALVSQGGVQVPAGWTPSLVSAHEAHVGQVRPILRTAAGAAALVLLVACGNVAGLLLIRAARRRREIAVRAALGAGSAALARMLLAEGAVLGAVATLAALFLTRLTLGWLAPMVQQQLGRPAPGGVSAFALDARVLTFAAAAGTLTAIVCTLVPLIASLRPRIAMVLQGGRGATEGRTSRRVRTALIVTEIAVSLALLAGSALMVKSLVGMLRTDLGFSSERVLNASLTLRQNRYPDAASRAAVLERIVARAAGAPGIEVAALTTSWPVQQPRPVPVEAAGAAERTSAPAAAHAVSSGYFAALRIPLVAGRGFESSDRRGAEPSAIVSESLARRLWPAGNVVGRRIVVPQAGEDGEPLLAERAVVGVVRDVRQHPDDAELGDVYVPITQAPTRFSFLLVRTSGLPAAAVPALRTALRDVDPELALHRARPLHVIVDEATARPRFLASLLVCFAVIAAGLALVGVYGVIAYAVRQREREIAVRLAVGADPARITRLFVRDGAVIICAGLVIGVLAALAAGRLIEAQLSGVTARDPVALSAAVMLFGVAGLAAVWWPARRAAATDPAAALRAE